MRVFCDELNQQLGHVEFFIYVREVAWRGDEYRFCGDFTFTAYFIKRKPDGTPIVLYNNVPADTNLILEFP